MAAMEMKATMEMKAALPAEVDWHRAPGLLDGAMNLKLTPQYCDLRYWLDSVTQGSWQGLRNGHAPEAVVPAHMLEEGPLRSAMIDEFAFRFLGEEMSARAISYLVANAPSLPTMEFYATQLMDESRHAWAFRTHLLELGIAPGNLFAAIERSAGARRDAVLKPLEELALGVMRDERDFIGGVVVLTVLVEGVLAPGEVLSECKWRDVDPAAASIERGTSIDEIRHLSVGAQIVRDHLAAHPADKPRLLSLIERGRKLWQELPVQSMVVEDETIFQQGLEMHRAAFADYEFIKGRRLVEMSVAERLSLTGEWLKELESSRLSFMGLAEAIV